RARSGRLLDAIASLQEIGPEAFRAHFIHAAVRVSVHSDLIAAPGRFADERRISLGNPSQEEESGSMGAGVEHLENAKESALDSRGERAPSSGVREIVVAANVEPVLDIDRKNSRSAIGCS